MTTSTIIQIGEQNAWLIPLWSAAAGAVLVVPVFILHHLHSGKSFIQIPSIVLGPWAGKVVVLIYFLFFSMLLAWVLHNMSDFLKGTYMTETPKSVFHLMFLLVAVYAVTKGVNTIGSINQFVTPLLFFPFWISVLLGLPDWDSERFMPLFHFDAWDMFLQSHPFIAFPFMEWFCLFMLYPFVERRPGRALIMGIALAAVSISVLTAFVIGLVSVERASKLNFPVYTFVQEISLGDVITNIHAVISMVLLILIFIKVVILFYSVYISWILLVQPKTTWATFWGLVLFEGAVARCIYLNPVQNIEFINNYLFIYSSIFVVIIPGLLLIISWIKKAMARREGASL